MIDSKSQWQAIRRKEVGSRRLRALLAIASFIIRYLNQAA